MYDELVKRLRNCAELHGECALCLYEGNGCDAMPETPLVQAADTIEGLSHAVNQMTEWRKNSWIPVTERLPDQSDNRLYICLVVGGKYDQLSWYELCDFAEGRFWTQLSESECHVTHWMPLPEPPEEE